jgi:hypothetical protein
MSNDVIIPDLEGGPAAIFQERNIPTEHLGEGIDAGGFNLVGINGKEFYVRYKGQRKVLVNADDSPAQYFNFVVLRQAPRTSHTWYERGYQPGSEERPDCVSTDGLAPDDNSKKPQSELCQLCPQHEWRQQPNGRDGRACTDSLRLAVFPMPKLMVAALGEPITEPILFRIPAASLRAFAELGDQMIKRYGGNSPISSYVVRVTFKKDVKHPQFEYRVERWLSAQEAEMMLELRESRLAYRILGMSPDGNSIVRRQNLIQRAAPDAANIDASVEAKLAAEREARIAAARQAAEPAPKTIDLQAEEVVLPVQKPVQKPVQQTPIPLDDAPADMDALVAAMRPRPPGA